MNAAPREIGLAERARLADGFVEATRSGADTGRPTIEGGGASPWSPGPSAAVAPRARGSDSHEC